MAAHEGTMFQRLSTGQKRRLLLELQPGSPAAQGISAAADKLMA